jgi:hypothetical protein
MRRLLCGVTAWLLLLCASSSFADTPQDVVVLTSGNRITGQVRSLSRGELIFRVASRALARLCASAPPGQSTSA